MYEHIIFYIVYIQIRYIVSANDIKFKIEYHANIERKIHYIKLSFFLTTFGVRL